MVDTVNYNLVKTYVKVAGLPTACHDGIYYTDLASAPFYTTLYDAFMEHEHRVPFFEIVPSGVTINEDIIQYVEFNMNVGAEIRKLYPNINVVFRHKLQTIFVEPIPRRFTVNNSGEAFTKMLEDFYGAVMYVIKTYTT